MTPNPENLDIENRRLITQGSIDVPHSAAAQLSPSFPVEIGPLTSAHSPSDLRKRIEQAINGCSAENGSNTPDFILAEYLTDCLAAFDRATLAREKWYGVTLAPGSTGVCLGALGARSPKAET